MEKEELIILLIYFVGSFLGVYLIIPRIIVVARYSQLMDKPNRRSSHKTQIPRLGGVAFFITFILGLYFLNNFETENVSLSIIAGLLVLFIIGLKDDLVIISPITKLAAQIISSLFIFINPHFIIDSFHGFLGIHHIHPVISMILVAFFIVYIINALNLIDGIDGLAAIISIVAFLVFGILFYLLGDAFFFGLSLIGIGILLAFLRFNFSSRDKKIFMGDTGSMILGFMISILAVKILSYDFAHLEKLAILPENIPLLVICILFIPIFDTGRIFLVRLSEKRDPFSPDRQHVHHIIIDHFKLAHKTVSILLGLSSIVISLSIFFLSSKMNNFILTGIVLILVVILLLVFRKLNPLTSRLRRHKAISKE